MEIGTEIATIVGAIAILLLVAAATLALSKRTGFPYTVGLVLVGLGLSLLGRLGLGVVEPLHALDFSPGVVFFVLLPSLVFESAFNMDGRALRENIAPVLAMAIPGVLLSTGIMGAIMHWTVGMEWPMALLLGTILSATDPAGITALFRQLGTPKRLSILVEGESLFNDATSIVVSRILLAVILAGSFSAGALAAGLGEFALVFFGGILIGWAAAAVVGMILGRVAADAFIEISLSIVLAYFTFIVAEVALGVSGVMATVAAGLLIGGWGRIKISPELAGDMERFWEYLAGASNALLFLMVGLRVDLSALTGSLDLVAMAVVAMLISRAAVVYGLVPLLGHLPRTEPIDRSHQTVMFWGGIRGGIALAIALSLPEFPGRDVLIAVSMGAVLFSLSVPGFTMQWVVERLGLDIPPVSDRLAQAEGQLAAKGRSLRQIPVLEEGGLFSPRIAQRARERCEAEMEDVRAEIETLRNEEMDPVEERRLLFLRCFSKEQTLYYQMFEEGHLSEWAYRDLIHSIELQIDDMRHDGKIPEFTLYPPGQDPRHLMVLQALDGLPGFGSLIERIRARRTAKDYEVSWARSRVAARVLDDLDEGAFHQGAPPELVLEVRGHYERWLASARQRMDLTTEQFPEFVASTQRRLAERLVLHAEKQSIEDQSRSGALPTGVAERLTGDLSERLRRVRAAAVSELRVDPTELLRKVPFFQDTPEEEFALVAEHLYPRTIPAGMTVIREGESGSSLFLVARGVIRVTVRTGEGNKVLATLMAGDFFGEIALLHGGARTATCRAVTPCALYELRRADLERVRDACPAIEAALIEADQRRGEELRSARSSHS